MRDRCVTVLPPAPRTLHRLLTSVRTRITVARRVSRVRVPVDAVFASLPTVRPNRKKGAR